MTAVYTKPISDCKRFLHSCSKDGLSEWSSPVVPANNPIWVEHWNELEDKHVSQCMSTRVISP